MRSKLWRLGTLRLSQGKRCSFWRSDPERGGIDSIQTLVRRVALSQAGLDLSYYALLSKGPAESLGLEGTKGSVR